MRKIAKEGVIPLSADDRWLANVDDIQEVGVILGQATAEEAHAPALQKVLRRAISMQHWALTLE